MKAAGTADRDPAWSPDGKSIAYFSDESGEYELHLKPQDGLGDGKKYKLGDAPSFYYSPFRWSPDGKRIAYSDKRKQLWYIDLDSGKSTKVDTDPTALAGPPLAEWSPDSKWIAYVRSLKSQVGAMFLYSLETGKAHQITDGMSDDARTAKLFDKNGKYLYFLASTDSGPVSFGSMASFNRAQTSAAYVVVLNKKDPSPLLPESDDEQEGAADKPAEKSADQNKDKEKKDEKERKEPPKVQVDLENLDQRILALPIPNRNYDGIFAGKANTLYLLEAEAVNIPRRGPPPGKVLHKFDLSKRKFEKLLDDVNELAVSNNGGKILYRVGPKNWFLIATDTPAKPGEGPPKPGEGAQKPGEKPLKLDEIEVKVDPRAEWKQIYHETWRLQRDFLYDPNAHGLNLAASEKKYEPYLAGLGSRHDLSLLMEEMLGELCLGHVYLDSGDTPEAPDTKTGLLGADYAIENDRFKFAKIYRGEGWNPELRAPLLQPGSSVKEWGVFARGQ